MISAKHPLEQYNTAQENFINNLADKDKEYHSLLFSYGNASYLYHNLPIEPSFEDYTEWLEGLQENIRKDMQSKGFETCKSILSFTRYVREKRDIHMEDFIIEKMGIEQYGKYKELF
ncbi:hypothetical protein SAMN05444360_1344 [Chryseobacterium carnipullorum]|uniref:Uncharacterized protein n=2 Tax=Chryseobacterium TaxID=59732 RepID=A0A1M5X9K5_9FLAO|nr:hypothetical protein [Chryseobacterium carnipullorum]SHH96342.1 hypothetical protein SAMN05421866_0059 [Chryseobacterium oranimense]SHN06520.1 hypothetical protein SAMN05444360_1344 [Chryseobacterium carnipullorum]